ncbi:MAG: NEL-type E3 ubiquitin ligase domain-containing protein [Limnobacter sp.]|nr:NEL-type E3 ubiquitin ligase domain-containing protein [Limnobacter sp.]
MPSPVTSNPPEYGWVLPSQQEFCVQLTAWQNQGRASEYRRLACARIEACFLAQTRGQQSRQDSGHTLDLGALQLHDLPDCIGLLSTLTHLRLCDNYLRGLPESFNALTQLHSLNLSNNRLGVFPPAIGGMTQLKTLNLEKCGLEHIPDSIQRCSQLQHINLDHNQLRTLPHNIILLRSLSKLEIRRNQLVELPHRLGELHQLEELNVAQNELRHLPLTLGNLSRLRKLDISFNPIAQLPPHFNPHTQLQEFRAIQSLMSAPAAANPRQNTALQCQLLDHIQHFKHHAGHPISASQALSWQRLLATIPSIEQNNLRDFFRHIRASQSYNTQPSNLLKPINTVLDRIQQDPGFIQTIAAIAKESLEHCEDRTTLSLIQMVDAALHHEALAIAGNIEPDNPTLQRLERIGMQLFKSKTLQTIAKAKITSEETEGTEIILKYWVALSTRLNLPCPITWMRWPNLAQGVSPDDLQHAFNTVNQQASGIEFANYLCTWPAWQAGLQHCMPAEFQALQNRVDALKEQLRDELDQLLDQPLDQPSSQNLIEHTQRLQHAYFQVEPQVFMPLTQAALASNRIQSDA